MAKKKLYHKVSSLSADAFMRWYFLEQIFYNLNINAEEMIKKFVKCKYVKWQIRFKEVQIYIESMSRKS